jgi:hypothetical protein
MKKKYMKPEMEVYKMESVNMVCDSPGIKGGSADKNKDVLAKELPDWDEELDNILW